ncbi:hypothetical protein [Algoriphagus terrigena]|uniref:hypothetical protein n=1 Tax=Algoriphagus terrigena TaxID=344884 RepID=UPI0003FB39B1|nr:hypothetical protein [Algoriphagus terrigena]
MKNKEANKKPAPTYQKVRKVSPLGNLEQEPPTRNEKPHSEFIDEESNITKKKPGA